MMIDLVGGAEEETQEEHGWEWPEEEWHSDQGRIRHSANQNATDMKDLGILPLRSDEKTAWYL